MKKNLWAFLALSLMTSTGIYARDTTSVFDSNRIHNPLYDSLNYPVKKFIRILQLADPQVMLAVNPLFYPVAERSIPLSDGEGKGGYILENNFEVRLPIYFGGIYSNEFKQRLRLTFDGGYTVRMTKDSSSPLVPNNNKFGLGLDYLLFDNNFLTIQFHHYSNGQSDHDFYASEDPYRNNYLNGDFSTNYIKIVPVNYFAQSEYFTSILSLGYRRDVGVGKLLNLSKELKESYGLNRLLFEWNLAKNRKVEIIKVNNRYKITNNYDWGVRVNAELILDAGLPNFPHTQKYRLSTNALGYFYPFKTAVVGVFLKGHYGRDYLNIRYDDVVFSVQGGFIFDLPRTINKAY